MSLLQRVVAEIETLKPFPDVVNALGKLRSGGYGLAIPSNGDRDMLKAAERTSASHSVM